MADLVSGQAAEIDDLTPASRAMLALRDTVITQWETNIRAVLHRADALRRPILVNTLPSFYDNLATLLTPRYFRVSGIDVALLAAAHGSERARLSGYDTTNLIQEYQIFRHTLFEQLRQAGITLSHEHLAAINSSIDSAMRESVNAFALVQAALREQFIAALTHDLRTPLSTASMAAQVIERTSDDSRIRALAQRILASTERMDGMTRDLLDSMVFQSGERLPLHITAFDMAELGREVVEFAIARYGVQIVLDTHPACGWWCHESLKRALENLVGNAVKYGADGQSITLRVAVAYERVLVTVHNLGQPIPAEQIESIFQIYRRADNVQQSRKEGWGVGLPYARRVAESHGGSIVVTSDAQTGTTFLLDIPLDARPHQDAPTAA